VLNVEANQLSGAIPAELGKLPALEALYLSNNRLSGAIPDELGQLPALETLHLSYNQLSGAIPVGLGQLGALGSLHLCDNQLSGLQAFRSHMDEHNPECALVLVPEDEEEFQEYNT
jgi:Leucine-rich repeat (LRR) protein